MNEYLGNKSNLKFINIIACMACDFFVSLYVYGWLVKRVNVTMAFWIDLIITSVIVFLLANLFHKIVEKRIEWLLQKVQK